MDRDWPPLNDDNGVLVKLVTGANKNKTYTFVRKDTGGNVVNITGLNITVIGKSSPSDADGSAIIPEIAASIVSGPAGTFSVDFSGLTLTSDPDVFLIFNEKPAAVNIPFATYKTKIQQV